MERLKPCPFCGSESVDITWTRNGDYAVNCDATRGGCGATGGYEPMKEAAIKTWNRRMRMTDETEANLKKVNEILGEEELLCQLAEECAELGRAALKLRRAWSGQNFTPVTIEEAIENLMEESADVITVLDCLGPREKDYAYIIDWKAKRWLRRLTGTEE